METHVQSAEAIGTAVVDAIAHLDFDRLEGLFDPNVSMRAITPRTIREASTAEDAAAIFAGWFEDSTSAETLDTKVETVVDRLHFSYRLRFLDEGAWKVAEQQGFGTVEDGRMTNLWLVCSGFRPVETPAEQSDRPAATGVLDARGEDCATLTPRIAAAMRRLDAGQVLDVIADDPAAEEGLKAWTRMTGNELVGVEQASGAAPTFSIRRS